MKLEHLEADFGRAHRGGRKARLDLRDLGHRQLRRHQPAILHRLGTGGDNIPDILAPGAVGVVERPVAMPRALHAGLAARMGDLDRRYRAFTAQEVGNGLERGGMRIRPDTQVAVRDPAARLDRRRLGEHGTGPAHGELPEMHQMPVSRETVGGAIGAHGGDDRPVAESDTANVQRREKPRGRYFGG